jgi:transcriptional regulator with XRE-family HTH domain
MVKLTRLRDVRQRKALTQQQLAERAGVNRVTIARIEGGKDEPFPTTVRKVADALGVEPDDLMETGAPATASEPAIPAANGAAHGPANGATVDLALDARITVTDEKDVWRLLRSEPDLLPLVNEAAEQLSRYFPDARLRLEYQIDPDEGAYEELFLGAWTDREWTDQDLAVAMAALDRFDREWWFHHGRRANGLLIIDVR